MRISAHRVLILATPVSNIGPCRPGRRSKHRFQSGGPAAGEPAQRPATNNFRQFSAEVVTFTTKSAKLIYSKGLAMSAGGQEIHPVSSRDNHSQAGGSRRRKARRQPYSWLGASALSLGVGAAVATGSGLAHADAGADDDAGAPAPLLQTQPRQPVRRAATALGGQSQPRTHPCRRIPRGCRPTGRHAPSVNLPSDPLAHATPRFPTLRPCGQTWPRSRPR